jgi:plasmanylethanolamine desaturase
MRSRLLVLADAAHVTLAVLLIGALGARIAWSATQFQAAPFVAGLVLGFVAADAASGIVHWLCDTYSHPEAKLIGPMFIAPFREHHIEPTAIARHGFLERNGNNCLVALPLLALALCEAGASDLAAGTWRSAATAFWSALAVTLCLTNQIHAWAHSEAPFPVRWLQRAGVLLAPERHAAHHRGGHAYAVVSGWSNPCLDRALPRLGAWVRRIFPFRRAET